MIRVQANRLCAFSQNKPQGSLTKSCALNSGFANSSLIQSLSDRFRAKESEGKSVSFGSLRGTNNLGCFSTDFFRGLKTSEAGAKFLINKFPKGTNVLGVGGSSGAQQYIKALLANNPAFKFISLDINPEAIEIGKRGIHSVFNHTADEFLIRDGELTHEEQYLKSLFLKYFSPIEHQGKSFNCTKKNDSSERFFMINDELKALVEFRKPEHSNILKIDEFELEKPIGMISFSNGTYELTGNQLGKVILLNEPIVVDIKPLGEIADKVHLRLEKEGYLELGSCMNEFLYVAPKGVPDSETIPLSSIKSFCNSYRGNLSPEALQTRFLKKSPLVTALKKDGKFKPVFWDSVEWMPEVQVPTIWQKV